VVPKPAGIIEAAPTSIAKGYIEKIIYKGKLMLRWLASITNAIEIADQEIRPIVKLTNISKGLNHSRKSPNAFAINTRSLLKYPNLGNNLGRKLVFVAKKKINSNTDKTNINANTTELLSLIANKHKIKTTIRSNNLSNTNAEKTFKDEIFILLKYLILINSPIFPGDAV
jgi:hypothetical protein